MQIAFKLTKTSVSQVGFRSCIVYYTSMAEQDRRTTIIVAIIAAVAAIFAALINGGIFKRQTSSTTEPTKMENKAETKGEQSPAIAGSSKDVTITYAEPKSSPGTKK